ncbi:tripartite motif-containing protein 54-like [Osmerus mordax]|uniref:tripartite motif-containing protein 54-like n=1 Tax=Osmerus mordax TaxID=8014 RepID=UPI00351000A5
MFMDDRKEHKMEALCKELSCPVCLDLFTPPVIELPCGHNYCKKCLKETVVAQKSTEPNQKFPCPMCRKAFALDQKGINGMKRNMFAENVLDKVKEGKILENKEAKHVPKTQMCPEHNEKMSLICLEENTLICSSCKLFGDHSTHTVSRISDVYEQRKKGFIQLMKSLEDKLNVNAKHIENLEQQKGDLHSNTKDIEGFLQKLGNCMIKEIQKKVANMIFKVHTEYSIRCKSLEDGKEELSAPQEIYAVMKKHLDVNKCPTDFLKQERRLFYEAAKILDPKDLSANYRENISLGRYVEDLLKGIDFKKMGTVKRSSFMRKISQDLKAWKSGRTNFDLTAYRSLDIMLIKTTSLESDSNCDEDCSLSWEIQSSSDEEDI